MKLKIDGRSIEEIEQEIGRLAKDYVPEWHFDTDNPDIGSTLGIMFARQTAENIARLDQVLDKYHTEFVNMLDISPLSAKPAGAVVLMNLNQDTIQGVSVPKGTKLLANRDSGEEQETQENQRDDLIFETAHNVFVTAASLKYVYMTAVKTGAVLPLMGDICAQNIVEPDKNQEGPEILNEVDQVDNTAFTPFTLFREKRDGIQMNALVFYLESVLDVEGEEIIIHIANSEELVNQIASHEFEFQYYTEKGFLNVEEVKVDREKQNVHIRIQEENKKVVFQDGKEYSILVLKAGAPIKENIHTDGITFASNGKERLAESINDGTTDLENERFYPFGDTLALYGECYIGMDEYFKKKGSNVQISFDTTYEEHKIQFTIQQQKDELKIIKRKPKTIQEDTVADAYAEEVAIEYFNGIGWKKLGLQQERRSMFQEAKSGTYGFSFVCPSDWQKISVGAYEGRCIRMRLVKSDNCYLRPCIHHYPVISNLKISYSYINHFMTPEHCVAFAGTRKLLLDQQMMGQTGYTAFYHNQYNEDALYMGFNKKMTEGPVSLFFSLEDRIRYEGVKCSFEYSSMTGFKQMKVQDHTANLSRSGVIMFIPPSDMREVTLEGKKGYWIRMKQAKTEPDYQPVLPKVLNIAVNAVEVRNIDTKKEEDYYIGETVPNMVFELGTPDILDADVWVNEVHRLSESQIEQFLQERPGQIRVERDIMGVITAVYIKWTEVEQFQEDLPKRQYILDRLSRQIKFGDGLQTDIPRVMDGVAFKVKARCSNGVAGNVRPGSIDESFGTLLFVDQITNPMKAFGGSDMENLDSAMERGSQILSARRRLVSVRDYEREILSQAGEIDKVKSLVGEKGALIFILLMKDFASGSYSFHNAAGSLKDHLLKNCELTIEPEELHIIEPLFVSIHVDVWVHISDLSDSFEIQTMFQNCLTDYLNPISTQTERGWDIGVIPQKAQIIMRLGTLKQKAYVQHMSVTAQYSDENGNHEVSLEELEKTPYMTCCSGKHRVHFINTELSE